VQVKSSPLGFNPDLPPLETADRAVEQAKDAYKTVFFRGNVERRFLYATLLSTDLLPFGHLDYRLVVLPIEPEKDHYRLITAKEARKRGFYHLAQWLEKAEEEWTKRRGAKRKQISALDWLDYRKKLTLQNLQAKYRIVYPDVQRMPVATVIRVPTTVTSLGHIKVEVSNLIIDMTSYVYETNNSEEAHYLASFLNSSVTDEKLSALRRRKQKTHPHVGKKIFDVAPIPQLDTKNAAHLRLAELGKECTHKVDKWVKSGGAGKIKSIGKLRSMVRQMLKPELTEIDNLVKQLLEAKE
jgi:hypothetical protein